MTDPDLIVPENPAKLFRCQGLIEVPAGEWVVVLVPALVPVKEGDRLLGFARVDNSPRGQVLRLHMVLDFESITRFDVEIGKPVFAWPLWTINTEADGPRKIRLGEVSLVSMQHYPGQLPLSGEVL